jgi:hypothetical protein
MSLETEARTALASIATGNPAWSVAVVISGTAGTGLDAGTTGASDFGDMGEAGVETGTVRVNAATFPKPDPGDTITVRGVQVTVLNVSGVALWVIQYRNVRPVEGV